MKDRHVAGVIGDLHFNWGTHLMTVLLAEHNVEARVFPATAKTSTSISKFVLDIELRLTGSRRRTLAPVTTSAHLTKAMVFIAYGGLSTPKRSLYDFSNCRFYKTGRPRVH